MGYDYIIYKERHERFDVFSLFTLRHFLAVEAAELDRNDPDAIALRSYLEHWEWWGPAVVSGTEPETFIGTSERRKSLFLELLSRTKERIEKFGVEIPLDYLELHINQTNRVGARHCVALETEPLVNMIGKICRLFSQ